MAVVPGTPFKVVLLVVIKWMDWSLVGVAHMVSMAGGSRENLSCGAAGSIVEFGWLTVLVAHLVCTVCQLKSDVAA